MTDPMDDLRQASADVSGVEILSPAAQAVLEALYMDELNGCQQLMARSHAAAALRAAALYCKRDTLLLLSLADELEANSQFGES